ncbi:basic amino acid ABC transporter substrate-binding protein [Paenibacillus sp. GP183]|jgi:glutamine transport system substrate-binding protein|uniref:basic amino acid ABC transporter substrate-binding protein n=1 Tax=Paenibacillus sp. GP183 TaxID=1882751 RepID=UPI00089A1D44|nr:basic amino acid ABC transporter substrate-binding protein [Paenibacillus sp. GP183]SEC47325.1 amino acid ABC transporter substrate-binding protein, PAAT family [Paenibacillus sp. GP183]
MKKWSVMIAAIVLIISLMGCASNGTGGSGKKVLVASDATYSPMEYMDKDKMTGFDIEFLAEVMKEAGISYEVKNVGWDAMLESVKQGTEYKAGISSITITDERKQSYDFSIPYFESINMILVKADSPVKSADDLKGKKVAVQGGTTADELMTKVMGTGNTSLKKFDSNAVALLEMEKGGVEAVVADIAVVREYVKNHPDKKLKSVPDTKNFVPEYYGIAFPKGSDLKAKIDPAIKKLMDNGSYAKLFKKWFNEDPNIANIQKAS